MMRGFSVDTKEIQRTWALLPRKAKGRVVRSAAISAALSGIGGAGGPYLISTGGLHSWGDLQALGWVCLYGGLLGVFIHFKNPGIRTPFKGKEQRGKE